MVLAGKAEFIGTPTSPSKTGRQGNCTWGLAIGSDLEEKWRRMRAWKCFLFSPDFSPGKSQSTWTGLKPRSRHQLCSPMISHILSQADFRFFSPKKDQFCRAVAEIRSQWRPHLTWKFHRVWSTAVWVRTHFLHFLTPIWTTPSFPDHKSYTKMLCVLADTLIFNCIVKTVI